MKKSNILENIKITSRQKLNKIKREKPNVKKKHEN